MMEGKRNTSGDQILYKNKDGVFSLIYINFGIATICLVIQVAQSTLFIAIRFWKPLLRSP